MNEIWAVLLGGILADNIICNRCIGVVGGEFSLGTFRSSSFYSIWVTVLSLASTAVCYPLVHFCLVPLGGEYLYILLLSGVTAILLFLLGKLKKNPLARFSTLQKTVIFATALGISSLCLGFGAYHLALIAALSYGIGLYILMLVFFCARLSLKQTRVPTLLQNTAIDMIIVAIIALVFQGFR